MKYIKTSNLCIVLIINDKKIKKRLVLYTSIDVYLHQRKGAVFKPSLNSNIMNITTRIRISNADQQLKNLNFTELEVCCSNAEAFAQQKGWVMRNDGKVVRNFGGLFEYTNEPNQTRIFYNFENYCINKIQKSDSIEIDVRDFIKFNDNKIIEINKDTIASKNKERIERLEKQLRNANDLLKKAQAQILELKNKNSELENKVKSLLPVEISTDEKILLRNGFEKIEWDSELYRERNRNTNIDTDDYSFSDIVEIEALETWYDIKTGEDIEVIKVGNDYYR